MSDMETPMNLQFFSKNHLYKINNTLITPAMAATATARVSHLHDHYCNHNGAVITLMTFIMPMVAASSLKT